MTGSGVIKNVALMTPTYRGDLERFELLCESIDRFVSGYERHYVIVNDDDLPFFARFETSTSHRAAELALPAVLAQGIAALCLAQGAQDVVVVPVGPAPRLAYPAASQDFGRLAAAASALLHCRFRQRLLSSVRRGGLCRCGFDPALCRPSGDSGRQAVASGLGPKQRSPLGRQTATAFPADDYIGNVLVWDKSTLRDMTATIEAVTGMPWAVALGKARSFSEYILYGYFVSQSPTHRARHRLTTQSLATSALGARSVGRKGVGRHGRQVAGRCRRTLHRVVLVYPGVAHPEGRRFVE